MSAQGGDEQLNARTSPQHKNKDLNARSSLPVSNTENNHPVCKWTQITC